MVTCAAWLSSCTFSLGPDDKPVPIGPRSASCEALADRQQDQCRQTYADFAAQLERCEEERAQLEPQGCGEALARWVRCQAQAFYDCRTGEAHGCADEQDVVIRCTNSFVQRTGCNRSKQDQRCDGRAAAYAYSCLTTMPETCEASDAMYLACCPSFATETRSYFRDPESPDAGDSDAAACDASCK